MRKVFLLVFVISFISCDKKEDLTTRGLAQEVVMPENEGSGGIIIGNGGDGTNVSVQQCT